MLVVDAADGDGVGGSSAVEADVLLWLDLGLGLIKDPSPM